MWIEQLLASTIFFELLLFCLFLIAATYAIQTYVFPSVYLSMHEYQEHMQYLRGKKELLLELEVRLSEDSLAQEERISSMKHKLHIWQRAENNNIVAKKADLEKTYKELSHKRMLQQKNSHALLLAQAALGPAIEQAQEKLEEKFQGNAGASELNKLINSITNKNNACS